MATGINSTIADHHSIGIAWPHPSSHRLTKFAPRHRRAAGPARLRAGAVRLSGQPFPQPRARQYLDGCAGRRRPLPHAFWQFLPVAIVFYTAALVHAGLGIWALYQRRQFRWKAIEPLQLVLGLSIPALIVAHIVGVRLGQALYGHEKLYPQVFYAYWVVWPVQAVADVRGAAHRLGPWLHRAVFLAAHEGVLQARGAVPAGGGGADSDAGACSASIRADAASSPTATAPNGGRTIFRSSQVGTPAEQDVLDDITDYFLIGYLGLIGLVLLAQRRARAARAPRRHDQPVLWQRPDGAGAEGPERARGQPAQQRARMPASAAAAPAARPAASA